MERYGIANASIITDASLTLEARALYAILTTYCNKDRTCFPSTKTLGENARKSPATIFRLLRELEDKHVIRKSSLGRKRLITLLDEHEIFS